MSDDLTTCECAARAAGAVLMQWSGRVTVREKGPADLVTEADLASQETIRRILRAAQPDYGFVGEETSWAAPNQPPSDGPTWYVDPLDGTTNFVHGLPGWCVSIGLVCEGKAVCGCVYDPLHERCFLGARGEGAYLNGLQLQTSAATSLAESLVAVSLPPQVEEHSREISGLLAILKKVQGFRRMGSAALNLCYLAAGYLDGYWAEHIHPWDIAAGWLFVKEAGGVVTALDGQPLELRDGTILAGATPEVHAELLRGLRDARN